MKPLQLKPRLHRVATLPVVRVLQRILHDPDVMGYANLMTRTYVIGTWFNKRMGLVVEHYAIPEKLLADPAAHAQAISSVLWARGPASHQAALELRQALADTDYEDTKKAQEEHDIHTDVVEYLRKKATIHNRDHPSWLRM